MIAFNRDENNKDETEKIVEKLQEMLEQIYFEGIDGIDEAGYEETNLSELLSLVYQALFVDKHDLITVSIKKNKNNSLSLKIEDLK
tara:strand:- start:230 stop:487 length:258 start_codon:yes stop_codon:yes gene_type:complete